MLLTIVASVCLLAWVNGANDNFKGVATLFGAGVANYRRALGWGTTATLLGGIAAVYWGQDLLARFSRLHVQPNWPDPSFPLAVGLAAAITVTFATQLGMPVSTTHALIGALTGAGLASGHDFPWRTLLNTIFLPLLASPIVAMTITLALYPPLRWMRRRLGIVKRSCVCIGAAETEILPAEVSALVRAMPLQISVGNMNQCQEINAGRLLGLPAEQVLTALHYLSAGLVSFARGWNDTPKIAALLIISPVFQARPSLALLIVAGVMAAGGWLMAERVAETLSHKITPMNAGQGFTANLATSALVLLANWYALPVSTTHVSGGSLFGLAWLTGQGRLGIIASIALCWVFTLPISMVCGYCLRAIF